MEKVLFVIEFLFVCLPCLTLPMLMGGFGFMTEKSKGKRVSGNILVVAWLIIFIVWAMVIWAKQHDVWPL